MHARVLQERDTGRKSVYVPGAHIQIFVPEGGEHGLIIAAFRTDGYNRDTGRPIIQWLNETCRQIGEVDVPDEIIDFAVASERARQSEVEGLADIMQAIAMTAADNDDQWQEPTALIQAAAQQRHHNKDTEYQHALAIKQLLDGVRGLQ